MQLFSKANNVAVLLLFVGLGLPPHVVKTIQDLIFWQYAKIISESAGIGKNQYGFVMDRFKKLSSG